MKTLQRLPVVSLLVFLFLVTGCHKKTKPFEPPTGVTPPPGEAQPSEPPAAARPKRTLEAPPLKPRAPSPGDSASLRLVQAGVAQMNSGNLDDAEQTFVQALRVSPTNGKPYYYLGVIAYKQKSYDRSLGFLAQAEVYLHNDSFWMSQVLVQEGMGLKAMNQRSEAKAKFQEALQRDPTNSWAQSELQSLDQ